MKDLVTIISSYLSAAQGFIWGLPMIILLLGLGLLLTLKLRVLQIRKFSTAMKMACTPHDGDPTKQGDVTSFAALCTALAATVGTANIAGVATAVSIGGPGALFWMFLAAFLGMATKYAECMLAVRYREKDSSGNFIGGPMLYIRRGIGPRYSRTAKILAIMFSVFGILAACFGIGTYTQVDSIVKSAVQLHCNPVHASVLVTVLVAVITFGGIRTISTASRFIVPAMAFLYIMGCLIIVCANIRVVPDALLLIVTSAFHPAQAVGGFAGATVLMAIQSGVARGIFSNEAGLGSAPIASASAKTNSAVEQGLISMTATFIDTMVICMLTGLTLIVTNAWTSEFTGVDMTTKAFQTVIGDTGGRLIVNVSLILFAFTSIIGWNFYAERCVIYLFGTKAIKFYRPLYICIVASYILVVVFVDAQNISGNTAIFAIWTMADIANGLMAFPNLIAIFLLRNVIYDETAKYFRMRKAKKAGQILPAE